MADNILNRINTILEATGTVPYKIDRLTLGDVLSMRDYSVGVENLVSGLTVSKNYGNTIVYLDVSSDIQPTNFLYRASSEREFNPFLFTPGERVAQGVSNVSTRLISDILPSWANTPKRSNSVICSNDYYASAEYTSYGSRRGGVVYVVIPPNNAHIMVSPTTDFWYAFSYLRDEVGLKSLDLISSSLLTFFGFFYYIVDRDLITGVTPAWPDELLKIKKNTQYGESKYIEAVENLFLNGNRSTILHTLSAIDRALSSRKFMDAARRVYNAQASAEPAFAMGYYIFEKKSTNPSVSIVKILDNLFDPDKNGFDSALYINFVDRVYPSCEMWTDKPCIFVEVGNVKFLTQLYHKLRG